MSEKPSYPNDSAIYDPYDFNTKWANIHVSNVYQFDNEPTNIIMVGDSNRGGTGGRDTNGYYNDLYQISFRLQRKELKSYESWMNWVEKIQPDYKFLTVDQKNTQTSVFQNVDDPWMFTEYIYKGTGKIYDPYADFEIQKQQNVQQDGGTGEPPPQQQKEYEYTKEQKYMVIQPALFDPQNRNVNKPLNFAGKVIYDYLFGQNEQQEDSTITDIVNKYERPMPFKKVKNKGWYKQEFGQYLYNRYTTGADGCILYRGQICVQSVKWGQHGNVPPHAVNMIAPKQYVQSNTKLVLRTFPKTVLGVPIYVDDYGKGYIDVDKGKYYVCDIIDAPDESTAIVEDGIIKKLAYTTFDSSNVQEKRNQISQTSLKTTNPKITVKKIATQIKKGDIVYNGCKYFGNIGNNKAGCTLQKNMTQAQKQDAWCCADCKYQSNPKCKYFLRRGKTVAFRYQCLPTNYKDMDGADINNLTHIAIGAMALGGVGGLAVGGQAMQMALQAKANRTYNDPSGLTTSTQINYEYVEQELNGVQVYLPPNSQNNKGAVIKRGTGQSAFEKSGLKVRSIYDGDTSQINYHRWLSKILPCYNKHFCNQTVGSNYAEKIQAVANCGTQYYSIGQNNQIITKTVPFCPYYKTSDKGKIACPYNTVNKTAMDFMRVNSMMYQGFYLNYGLNIVNYLLRNIQFVDNNTQQFVDNNTQQFQKQYAEFDNNEIFSKTLQRPQQEGTGVLVFQVFYKYKIKVGDDNFKYLFPNQNVAIIQLNKLFGLQQTVLQQHRDQDDNFYICTIVAKVNKYQIETKLNTYNQKQNKVNLFFYYDAYTAGQFENNNTTAAEKIATWFTVLIHSTIPLRDPTIIDNQIKFMGGYHPQYSQYECPPQEVLYKKQIPYQEQLTVVSKADEDEYGNSPNGTQKQVQFGHFIQENGEWILNQLQVGKPIVISKQDDDTDIPPPQGEQDEEQQMDVVSVQESVQYRAQTPTTTYQGGTCIRNVWSNSKMDPQSDKGNQQKKIVKCIVYTNDTAQSIDYLRKNPPTIQESDSKGNPVQRKVPVQITYPQALPLQRENYARCSYCDTVLAPRFLRFVSQSDEQNEQQKNNKCPWCGQPLESVAKYQLTKIPRTKAIGRIVVWGLPGTIVRTDSYFWKSPVMVSNALISQMQFKLGVRNSLGGGYQKSQSNSESQNVDRVAFVEDVGKYVKDVPFDLWKKYIAKNNSTASSDIASLYSVYQNSDYGQNNRTMINPNIPSNVLGDMIPTQEEYVINNKIINPFNNDSGLKMITNDYIRVFRNRLQPALGYYIGSSKVYDSSGYLFSGDLVSDQSHSPASPGEYQLYRTKYDDRKELSYLKYWVKKRITCKPIILAYCGDQSSQTHCKIVYSSGENEIGDLVKYYPQDPKWWFNHQVIGGIKTNLSGNGYHFDKSGFSGGLYQNYDGMKNELRSQCYILPHGFVPLDKQVVAAYLFYNAQQQQVYEPCIGQIQLPSGRKISLSMHYHPYTTAHQAFGDYGSASAHQHQMNDNLINEEITNQAQLKEYKLKHNIFDRDDIGLPQSNQKHYIDKYGDMFYIDNKTGLPFPLHYLYKNRDIDYSKTQDIHEFPWMQENLPYVPLMHRADMSNIATNINHVHQKNNFSQMSLPDCIRWDGFGTDIIQTKSENAIWKNYTKQQFQQLQSTYLSTVTVQIDIGDGSPAVFSFDQYYSEFVNILQNEMQPIPNYFDMSNMNTAGYIKKYQNISSKSTAIQGTYEQFVITQGGGTGGGTTTNTNNDTNAGNQNMLIDITEQFKKIYYMRLGRYFNGSMGQRNLMNALKLQISGDSGWEDVPNASKRWKPSSNQVKQSTDSFEYSKKFNDRLKQNVSSNSYYVLNSNYWYPTLNQDRVFDYKNDGSRININEIEFYYSKNTVNMYHIEGELTINVTFDGKQNYISKSIVDGSVSSIIDSNTLVSFMNEAAKNININIQNVNDNIIFTNTDFSDTVNFQFTGITPIPEFKKYSKLSNRIISYTDYFNEFNPIGLTNLNKSIIPNELNAWITRRMNQQMQYITFDLIQPPLEIQRRDYLADRGSITYDESKCDNQQCQAYNISNALYAKRQGKSPSQYCSACGKALQPVKKGCDCINSWWYTEKLQDNPVIVGIKIQPVKNINRPLSPISLFISNDNKNWQCILSLHPTADKMSYTYSKIYNNTQSNQYNNVQDFVTIRANAETYIPFITQWNNGNNSSNSEIGDGFNGVLNKGRYLRVVTMPQPCNRNIDVTNGYSYSSASSMYVDITYDFDIENSADMNGYKTQDGQKKLSWKSDEFKKAKIIFHVTEQIQLQNQETAEKSYMLTRYVKNYEYVNDGQMTAHRFYIAPINTQNLTINQVVLSYTEYYSQVYKLKVIGGSYIPSQVLCTSKPTIYTGDYNWQIKLGYLPIQFFKVSALVNNILQYPLTQILTYDQIDDIGFDLQVVTEDIVVIDRDNKGNYLYEEGAISYTTKKIKYYKIKTGKYYFDIIKRRIIMPRYGYATEYIQQVNFGLEGAQQQKVDDSVQPIEQIGTRKLVYKISLKELGFNLQKWGIFRDLIPNKYYVSLWSGSQKGVDVHVQAQGTGPSYQVQRGSICKIYTSLTALPNNGASIPLPDATTMYDSAQELSRSAKRRYEENGIPWIVYNKQLASVPQKNSVYSVNKGFFKINLTGVQLYQNNKKYWDKHIIGQECQNFPGRCQADVTLKGKPNSYLRGSLVVYAPQAVQKQIGSAYYKQWTGGMITGLTVSPQISGKGQRITNAYSIPYIIAYLKQRDPFTELPMA